MWKARNNWECFLLCILVTPHIVQQLSSLMNPDVCLVHFVYSSGRPCQAWSYDWKGDWRLFWTTSMTCVLKLLIMFVFVRNDLVETSSWSSFNTWWEKFDYYNLSSKRIWPSNRELVVLLPNRFCRCPSGSHGRKTPGPLSCHFQNISREMMSWIHWWSH
jgi:hypothetical protein